MNIFICHDHADRFVAQKLADMFLDVRRVKTFLDARRIRPGETIEQVVKNAIRDCHHFVVVLSEDSLKSQWVMWEIGCADILGKLIVPVLHGIEVEQVPDFIAANLAVQLNDFHRYVEQVRRRVNV